jgi:SnoaL-like polyketide cyclase
MNSRKLGATLLQELARCPQGFLSLRDHRTHYLTGRQDLVDHPFGPPTGRQFEQEGITIHRIEDGKIVEEWNQWDNLSVLQQLELAPER